MKVIKKINQAKKYFAEVKRPLALVPTMGYLHQGHLSLIVEAKKHAQTIVVSIFVNPTQFGPGEDFQKYPRDIKRDVKLLKQLQADVLFAPGAEEMYSAHSSTETQLLADQLLSSRLCGLSRPGHFDGVVTVVNKLFNIVEPDQAVFGKKDYQQLLIIQKMAADLKLNVKIMGSEIVREADGLALSSRNKYLDQQERQRALIINQTLQTGADLLKKGENIAEVKQFLYNTLRSRPHDRLDYLEIVSAVDLSDLNKYQKNKTLIAMAMYIGDTRLIDNIIC